jgi:hypothetical protein
VKSDLLFARQRRSIENLHVKSDDLLKIISTFVEEVNTAKQSR